jgi:hypothetical protein
VPFPTSSSPVGSPAGAPRPLRRVLPFLGAAAVLAACAALVGSTAGLVLLLAASAALLAATVVGTLAHWTVALTAGGADAPPLGSPLESIPGDVLGLQLRGLQERTAEKVSRALEDGREDLARELSDAYADDALRAITTAGLPPATPLV